MASWKFFLNNIEVEEPLGWDAIEFTAKRLDSAGIDQIFSTEIKFYDIGAKLLKKEYDQFFVNAAVEIKIQSDIPFNEGDYEFIGQVDFAIYSEFNVCDTDSFEITVGILQDSFRDKFKRNTDIKVYLESTKTLDNVTIPGITYRDVRLHRQELLLTGSARPLAELTSFFVTTGTVPAEFTIVLPFYWQSTDFSEFFGTTFDTRGLRPYDSPNLFNQNNSPVFVNNGNSTRRINYRACGDLKLRLSFTQGSGGLTSAGIYLIKWKPGEYQNNTATLKWESPGLPFDVDVFTSYSINDYIDIEPGYAFNFIIGYRAKSSYTYSETTCTIFLNSRLNLYEYNADATATTCDVITIEDVLRRLIYIMTGDPNGLLSNAFSEGGNGCYWNNAITNGLKIRNAISPEQLIYTNPCGPNPPISNFGIQTSFKEFFDGLNKIFCLGWAFEKAENTYKIRIEPIEYFYQNEIATTCQHVGELTQSAMTNKLVNQITIGYNDNWKNISINGSSAIHTERNYYVENGAMQDNSSSKLDLKSNFVAEGTAIEFSRRLQFYSDLGNTSDRPNDYQLFIIWINRNPVTINSIQDTEYIIPGESGTVTFPKGTISVSSSLITDFIGDINNVYNIYHTPARVACRWWKVLGMNTYGLADKRLRFKAGIYQTNAKSTINTTDEPCSMVDGLLYENTDIYPSLLNNYPITENEKFLFKPIEIKFDYPQSLCDFLDLADNRPYQKVKLTSGSFSVSGYIQEIQNKPEDDSGGTTSFVLLASNIPDPTPEPPPGLGPYNDAYNDAYL